MQRDTGGRGGDVHGFDARREHLKSEERSNEGTRNPYRDMDASSENWSVYGVRTQNKGPEYIFLLLCETTGNEPDTQYERSAMYSLDLDRSCFIVISFFFF
jgi:hypothetical protein